jgi:hypothetical protein
MSIMNSQRWPDDDDALLAELGQAIQPPDAEEARMRADAMAAFTWRTVDQELELLSLSHDSSLAGAAFRGAADTATPRILVFESDRLTLELQVDDELLMGQLVPARSGAIFVESAQQVIAQAHADDAGFFRLPRPPAGTMRLRVGEELITQWLPL